jgi:hypothetical protein
MFKYKDKFIAIDFDGTCVTHEFPKVGKEVPLAVLTLKELVEAGAQLILWTVRSEDTLEDACDWFEERGLPLAGVNENPTQSNWSKSPKAYAPIYIDDAALGCPLIFPVEGRPYADWVKVRRMLLLPVHTMEVDPNGPVLARAPMS